MRPRVLPPRALKIDARSSARAGGRARPTRRRPRPKKRRNKAVPFVVVAALDEGAFSLDGWAEKGGGGFTRGRRERERESSTRERRGRRRKTAVRGPLMLLANKEKYPPQTFFPFPTVNAVIEWG